LARFSSAIGSTITVGSRLMGGNACHDDVLAFLPSVMVKVTTTGWCE
jgi:hypothetical protein